MSDDRRSFIGGSDIGAIVGVSPWQNALDVYETKLGLSPPPDPTKLKTFRRGKMLEPIVFEMLREEREIATEARNRRYRDKAQALFACEVDGEAIVDGEDVNIEAKTSRMAHEWGAEGTEDIPPSYAAQAQWGLGITGKRRCIVAALVWDELKTYEVVRNNDVIEWLREEALKFWSLVEARTPPPPTTLAQVERVCARLVGMPVELSEAGVDAARRIFALRESIRAMEKEKEAQEFLLFDEVRRAWNVPADPTVSMPEDNAILTYQGKPLAIWRRQTRESVDAKRLREEEPMTFHKYARQSTYRVLAAPPKGKK